jgi:segregation and condensation protein B
VPANTLAQVLELSDREVAAALRQLRREYLDHGHGFVLREVAGGWRLYTAPQAAAYVERWVTHGRSVALSRAALETLAIVAYRQPVTRAVISEIRGVDADGAVRTLVARGLIEAAGRADTPGQPVLYGTTTAFLEQLGIGSIDDLPSLGVFAPPGPPPDEPAIGGYRAARRTLGGTRVNAGDPGDGGLRGRASGSEPEGGDLRGRASVRDPEGGGLRGRASGSEPEGGDLRARE